MAQGHRLRAKAVKAARLHPRPARDVKAVPLRQRLEQEQAVKAALLLQPPVMAAVVTVP